MAANKTAEEILKNSHTANTFNGDIELDYEKEFILEAMDKYANQQTSTLQKELEETKQKLQESEKQVKVASVNNQQNLEFFGNNIEFLKWYSGMSEEKILKAYNRWINETK